MQVAGKKCNICAKQQGQKYNLGSQCNFSAEPEKISTPGEDTGVEQNSRRHQRGRKLKNAVHTFSLITHTQVDWKSLITCPIGGANKFKGC